MDFSRLLKNIADKNKILKITLTTLGIFILALTYNMFFIPNTLVVGGVSGLSIIFNKLFNINAQLFIYIINFILLFISIVIFGFKKTKPAIFGSLLYPIMITFTLPLSKYLIKYFVFDEVITLIVLSSIFYGLANAIIYKMGYNTGGGDIIIQIMKKYLHMPDGKANLISSGLIVILAASTLDITHAVYGIIVVYISSIIVDKVLIGISKSKLFIIDTKKTLEIEKIIINDLHYGVTVINAKGGYSNKNKELLLCAVPTKYYFLFKEIILTIDKNAFLIINDCYDIEGGMRKNKKSVLSDLF